MDTLSKQADRRAWSSLSLRDVGLLWLALPLWIVMSLVGTLIDSAPYRAKFAALEGGARAVGWNGLMVLATYTLPNIAILCMLSSVLGAIAARARLGADVGQPEELDLDLSAPVSSAVLRGFLVYLTLISGVFVFGQSSADPTQIGYVKLAGVMSVFSFLLSYHPTLFGRLLERVGRLLTDGSGQPGAKTPTR
jgi:hypothetical protein